MSADFIARGLAARETARARRLRILRLLAASIERVDGRYPATDPSPPTIGADAAATAIASPKVWSAVTAPNDGVAWSLYTNRFTTLGAAYTGGTAFLPATENVLIARTVTLGDGSNPAASKALTPGPKLRFVTDAPKFELIVGMNNIVQGPAHEMRVDGQVVPTLFGSPANAANNYGVRYVPVQFGDGGAGQRRLRTIEIVAISTASNGLPGGIVTDQASFLGPAPQPDGLQVCAFGDSFTELGMGRYLGDLIGQADTWASGSGGTGWINDASGSRSDATERWPVDVLGRGFDVVFDFMGLNDNTLAASAAAYAAVMLPSYRAALAQNPALIFVLTGPMSPGTAGNGLASLLTIRDGKKLVADAFPRNAIFLNNLNATDPLASHPWVIGSGREGATTGDGNADLVTGSDGTHPTSYGYRYLAQRIALETARAIPALLAAQG